MSKKSYKAVIGLGFGDEGKGLTTNALCRNLPNSLVVRYSGGQQAGHTVTTGDKKHVFANFGSGTFAGTPTYWSKYCTIDPVAIQREYEDLCSKNVTPILYIDSKCPITTPYEKFIDQISNYNRKTGTCGVGVGETFAREESFYSLVAGDAEFPDITRMKMELILERSGEPFSNTALMEFYEALIYITAHPNIRIVEEMPRADNIIFEGSQGLLLDQHIGFFPHVTRSNTGTKNILEMVQDPELYLVTRAYQTRHGNGPMTNTSRPLKLKNIDNETNINNQYQGEFRTSVLDVDLLKYGMWKDEGIRNSGQRNLIITCCDQIDGNFQFTMGGNIHTYPHKESFGSAVAARLGIKSYALVSDPAAYTFV